MDGNTRMQQVEKQSTYMRKESCSIYLIAILARDGGSGVASRNQISKSST
jgi:hypothetical protein